MKKMALNPEKKTNGFFPREAHAYPRSWRVMGIFLSGGKKGETMLNFLMVRHHREEGVIKS